MVRGPFPVLLAAFALGGAAPAYAASTEDVARDYVSAHASKFGVLPSDLGELSVQNSYKTSGTGVTHVSVVQRHAGLGVFGSQATVNIDRDGRIVFAAGSLVRGLSAGATPATLDAAGAVKAAADALGLDEPAGL